MKSSQNESVVSLTSVILVNRFDIVLFMFFRCGDNVGLAIKAD